MKVCWVNMVYSYPTLRSDSHWQTATDLIHVRMIVMKMRKERRRWRFMMMMMMRRRRRTAMIMTGAIRQSLLLVDSLVEWHDRKYSLYCLLRPTISNIFMIILLTNCAAIKKVIVVKSWALGGGSPDPCRPHAISRLTLAPSVSVSPVILTTVTTTLTTMITTMITTTTTGTTNQQQYFLGWKYRWRSLTNPWVSITV